MEKLKKLFFLLLALVLVVNLSIPARAAHPVPDLNRKGSVTITVRYRGKPVKGGEMTIYKVADVTEDDGSFYFTAAPEFAGAGMSFKDLSKAAEMAAELKQYIKDNKMSRDGLETKEIGDDGIVTFSELELGLYLFVQWSSAPAFSQLDPFLVSVPYLEGDQYIYDIDAGPKADVEREPELPPPPDDKLPQTGQTNWPIPALSAAGLLLFAAGWYLLRGKREQNEA